jgi:hypothetical protein
VTRGNYLARRAATCFLFGIAAPNEPQLRVHVDARASSVFLSEWLICVKATRRQRI